MLPRQTQAMEEHGLYNPKVGKKGIDEARAKDPVLGSINPERIRMHLQNRKRKKVIAVIQSIFIKNYQQWSLGVQVTGLLPPDHY